MCRFIKQSVSVVILLGVLLHVLGGCCGQSACLISAAHSCATMQSANASFCDAITCVASCRNSDDRPVLKKDVLKREQVAKCHQEPCPEESRHGRDACEHCQGFCFRAIVPAASPFQYWLSQFVVASLDFDALPPLQSVDALSSSRLTGRTCPTFLRHSAPIFCQYQALLI